MSFIVNALFTIIISCFIVLFIFYFILFIEYYKKDLDTEFQEILSEIQKKDVYNKMKNVFNTQVLIEGNLTIDNLIEINNKLQTSIKNKKDEINSLPNDITLQQLISNQNKTNNKINNDIITINTQILAIVQSENPTSFQEFIKTNGILDSQKSELEKLYFEIPDKYNLLNVENKTYLLRV